MKGLTYILKDEGCFWENSCVGDTGGNRPIQAVV